MSNIISIVSFTKRKVSKCKNIDMYEYMKETTLSLPKSTVMMDKNSLGLGESERSHSITASSVVVMLPLTHEEIKKRNRKMKRLQNVDFLV